MENQSQIATVQQYLENIPSLQLVEDKTIENSFIQSFEAIHGTSGAAQFQKEKFYFNKVLQENPVLQECTKLSLYGSFMELASNGLSLDPGPKPLCYLVSRNAKSGRKNDKKEDIYEKRAYLLITGPGELVERERAGQVKHADNPVIVYDGDFFEPGYDDNGKKYVKYKMAFPRKSKKITACFIKIERPDGSVDFQWLLEDDFLRLKAYSEKQNSYWEKQGGKNVKILGKANALYTSCNGGIDPGFLESKMIKHAFDAFPKVRTSNFALLETNETEKLEKKNEAIQEANVINDNEPFGGAPQDNNNGTHITDTEETF